MAPAAGAAVHWALGPPELRPNVHSFVFLLVLRQGFGKHLPANRRSKSQRCFKRRTVDSWPWRTQETQRWTSLWDPSNLWKNCEASHGPVNKQRWDRLSSFSNLLSGVPPSLSPPSPPLPRPPPSRGGGRFEDASSWLSDFWELY